MDLLKLVDEIEEVVENGGSVPFTKKVMIDSEELLEIVREIRLQIPEEIKQATLIKEEKQRILSEAQKDANNILHDAEDKLEVLIEREEVTKIARERAEEIISNAQSNAKEIRLGSMEYADSMLLETQEKLKEVIILLNDNRKELRGDN